MIRQTYFRTVNFQTLAFFFLSSSLLLLCAAPNSTILDVFGGFSATGGVNVLGIIRWNLCVFPPVLVSTIFISREIGSMYIFTILRMKSVSHWCKTNFAAVYFINITYFFVVLSYSVVCTFWLHCNLRELLMFGMQFTFHTTMISLLTVFVGIFINSLHAALVTFLLVEGFGVVVGSVAPKVSPFLLSFWGMSNNENYLFNCKSKHFAFTQGFTFFFAMFLASTAIVYIKKHSPGEKKYFG